MAMKNTTHLRASLSILIFALFAWHTLPAQVSGSTSVPTGREYRLQALYRAGIAQNYEIVEQIATERTHSDGNVKSYTRNVRYFMTIRCIESLNGQSTIVVGLDSLRYSFLSEGVNVTYDSQVDITPKNFADLNNYVGPLNRPFELTYSPYGEVSNLKGEQITFWSDYLEENKNDMDSVILMIWQQSIGRDNLLQYGDIQKRVVPGLRKAVDSSWSTNLSMRIDGIVVSGPTTSVLTKYDGSEFTIVTADTLNAPPQPVHVYGIPYIANVTKGSSIIKNTLVLSTAGTITNVQTVAATEVTCAVRNEVFTQKTTSTTTCTLLGQFQW